MLIHWLWYALRTGMNNRDKLALLERFQTAEDIFNATASDYFRAGLQKNAAAALQDKDLSQARRIMAQCEEMGIGLVAFGDAQYPSRLKYIADPPMVLYYKGKLPDFGKTAAVGVVGTRKASVYGLQVAKRLGFQLGICGGMVISGMAEGIDEYATKGALLAGGKVIGVLGCGVDVVYPTKNRPLFAEMDRFGCLISEYPPGTPPYKWNFPQRNRIISGMSNGVLVVEAPEKSGALITARAALEQGRDVFVVPGNIDVASCAGSNALLREGATAVSHGWDILSEYAAVYGGALALRNIPEPAFDAEKPAPKVAQRPTLPAKKQEKTKKPIDNGLNVAYSDKNDKLSGLSDGEQQLVRQLLAGERLVDDVIAGAGLNVAQAKAMLTMLEIKGVIASLPGGRLTLK
jgi:DNA processing protein